MYRLLIFTCFNTILISSSKYQYLCPTALDWHIRSKALCRGNGKYSCLHDENKDTSREICRQTPRVLAPGNKYVIRGNLDGERCNANMYQPFIFNTTQSSQCVMKKSDCSEEGQIAFNNGSTTEDKSCRCDYSNSYALTEKSSNPCYCVPSVENCACYLKLCPYKTHLSEEYNCVSDYTLGKLDVCGPFTSSRSPIPEKPKLGTNIYYETTLRIEKDYLSNIFIIAARALMLAGLITAIGCAILIFLNDSDKEEKDPSAIIDNRKATSTERPEIITENTSYSIPKGKKAILHTEIRGTLTKIVWEKSNSAAQSNIIANELSKYEGGTIQCPTLTIKDVAISDQGEYICFATNDIGVNQSAIITLNIEDKKEEDSSAFTDNWKATSTGTKDHHSSRPRITGGKELRIGVRPASLKTPYLTMPAGTSIDGLKKAGLNPGYTQTYDRHQFDLTCTDFHSTENYANKTDQGTFSAQVALETNATKAKKKAQNYLEEEIRIVLVGKTGVGKSSTGNTLLGEHHFKEDDCSMAVTQKCMVANGTVRKTKFLLVDTPGIRATNMSADDIEFEIKKCIHLAAPGPHAVLFIIQFGRIKTDDFESIETFLEYFGKELKHYVIIVFTHESDMKANNTLESWVKKDPKLTQFLDECGGGYCAIDNNATGKDREKNVNNLMNQIEALRCKNGMICYTDDRINKAEDFVQEKERVIEDRIKEEYRQKLQKFESLVRDNKDKTERLQVDYSRQINALQSEYLNELSKVRAATRKEFFESVTTDKFKATILQKIAEFQKSGNAGNDYK